MHRLWKLFSILIFGVFVIVSGGCKTQAVSSHRFEQPVEIDELTTEWRGVPLTTLEKSGAALGIGNDDENLYILLRFRDPQWVGIIRREGLTCWIDNQGGKAKEFGLVYNGGPDISELMKQRKTELGDGGRRWNPPDEGFEGRELPEERFSILLKKWFMQPAYISPVGKNGPQIGTGVEHGFINYELKIPLSESGDDFYGLGVGPGETITIGLEWGIDMKRDPGQGMPGGGRGQGQGGGGGQIGGPGGAGGGGMKGGRQGGRMGGGQSMKRFSKQEVWLKVTLAAAK